jgi:presenilin-like A22 family membrane protease
MKHPLSTTALLILLFVAAQVVGLSLLSLDVKDVSTDANGVTTVTHNPTTIGDRPQTSGAGSLLYIIIGVGVGTALLLLIIRFHLINFWKLWFLLAVWLSTAIAVGVILPAVVALVFCLLLALWKVFWPNPFVHNFTEIFMYAGIAVLLAPLFTLLWAVLLLLIISVYDIIAVWQSKHMVTMAEAQSKNRLFAGLYIPKKDAQATEAQVAEANVTMPTAKGAARTTLTSKTTAVASKKAPRKRISLDEVPAPPRRKDGMGGKSGAILGGGDLAFPLIFSGVVMDWLIAGGTPRVPALYETLLVTLGATVALTLLFFYAKKDRYYPAMPFITAGCLAGLLVIWLL